MEVNKMVKVTVVNDWNSYVLGEYKTKEQAILIIQCAITKELIESNESNYKYIIS
jgi:uncharacterized phage-like protein YoqJ